MKQLHMLILVSVALIALSGCDNHLPSEQSNPTETESVPTKLEVSGIPAKDFDVIACSDPSDSGCAEAKAFDLKKQNIALLTPPKDIGVGEYVYFNGKRFGVVPKEEKSLNPLNFVAYGLFKYAQEVGSNWCGHCRLVAPVSYADAKKELKELFNLTGTKEQNEALLWLINRNLEAIGESGVGVKEAYFADIKAIAESLVNLTKKGEAPDLSHLHLVKDSKGRVLGVSSTPASDCPEYLGGCLDSWGLLDKNRAIKLGYNIRQKSSNLTASQQAFESLICEPNEDKQIFMYGVEDNFNQNNYEPVAPQGQMSYIYNMYGSMKGTYDVTAQQYWFKYFAETVGSISTNITKGRLAIGFKSSSHYPVNLYIGAYGYYHESLNLNTPSSNGWNLVANSNTYYKDLNSFSLNYSSNNLITNIQNGMNYIDIWGLIKHSAYIDYIALAACVPKPKPNGIPITEVPVKLECNADKGEHLVEVWGGNGDDFVMPVDTTLPPPNLNGTIKYDKAIKKEGVFADRISLPNQTITKMVVTVNTRAGANGYQNDKLLLGATTSSSLTLHDPNDAGVAATLNGGTAHQIYGSVPLTSGSGTLLSLVNSNHYLDVVTFNQTEVDSVRVSMCVVDKKDGDLNITKNPGRKFTKNGLNYSYFSINIDGILPNGEILVINEYVPNGAMLESYYSSPSTQPTWICTPNPPVSGPATITCSISAINGDITTIPTLNVLMSSKFEKLQNCVDINKESQNTSYNNNPNNDRDCSNVEFEPPKDGDLAITKKIIKSYTDRDGVNHAVYGISVSGTLPTNSPLTVDEVVPTGAILTNINAPAPWSCSPSAPVSGLATVTCTIPAQSSLLSPIPDIIVEMKTEEEKLENCANINEKFSPIFYNNNSENDRSCDTTIFKPVENCKERLEVDLSNPSIWKDSNGNNASPMTNISSYWDHSYTWLNATFPQHGTTTYKTNNFCACGEDGYVKILGLKTDNMGRIVLNNLTQVNAISVAAQTTAVVQNFLSSYPAAIGSTIIHSGSTYNLEFSIYNIDSLGGGAIKGKLIFTGHWGNCKTKDVVEPKAMEPRDTKPVVYSDVNSSGSFDENTTIAVIEEEVTNPNISNIGIRSKILIITGEDLQEIAKTPEEIFGNQLPSSYSIVVGCDNSLINVVIKGAITKSYETDIECSGNWVKYYTH